MSRAVIERAFPYAENGIDVRELNVGEELEIRDDVVGGLAAEGWLRITAAAPDPETDNASRKRSAGGKG